MILITSTERLAKSIAELEDNLIRAKSFVARKTAILESLQANFHTFSNAFKATSLTISNLYSNSYGCNTEYSNEAQLMGTVEMTTAKKYGENTYLMQSKIKAKFREIFDSEIIVADYVRIEDKKIIFEIRIK